MKKISIIIPSYNSGRFINKCLMSIINQKTYGEFQKEYIVIDNCSTDDTDDILNSYYQSNLIYIREKDKGVMDAWNKGLGIADGDYICFCNTSDYYFDPEWFCVCIEKMEKNNWISAVYGMTLIIKENGEFQSVGGMRTADSIKENQSSISSFSTFLLQGTTWNECTAILSRKAVDSLLPFDTVDSGATLKAMRQFYKNGYQSYFLKRIATVTLIHSDSKTSNQTDDKEMWDKHWLDMSKYRLDLTSNYKYQYRNNLGEVDRTLGSK